MPTQTQTYTAKSIFVSRTFWFNTAAFLLAVLELTEVVNIIPQAWMSSFTAVAAMINVGLRVYTVRPVAAIAPGDSVQMQVKKLDSQP